jgi:DNA-binding CsgD family transcriptional regulator
MKVEMSTKEIASVLNISPDSVKKAKTRLRRKLKVAPREDLIEKIDV